MRPQAAKSAVSFALSDVSDASGGAFVLTMFSRRGCVSHQGQAKVSRRSESGTGPSSSADGRTPTCAHDCPAHQRVRSLALPASTQAHSHRPRRAGGASQESSGPVALAASRPNACFWRDRERRLPAKRRRVRCRVHAGPVARVDADRAAPFRGECDSAGPGVEYASTSSKAGSVSGVRGLARVDAKATRLVCASRAARRGWRPSRASPSPIVRPCS
jgi:hypothetical protein